MKQNKQTFAERAKKLITHYKRADWDPIEAKSLENSLAKLQQEQEVFKAMNGLDTDQTFDNGGLFPGTEHQFPGTGQNLVSNPNMGMGEFPVEMAPVTEGNALVMGNNQGGFYDWAPGTNIPTQSNGAPASGGSSPYATSIAPSLISGGISTLGNLYLASQQKKSPQLNLPRIFAENISLEPSRQMAIREAAKGSTRAKYNIGRGSRTRGEFLANTGFSEAEISGKLGETLTRSKQEEILVNANRKLGMSQANAEIAAREKIYNLEKDAKNKSDKEAYISAALSNIGATSRDITAIRQQDAMINALGEDYGWYIEKDPNAKLGKKKKVVSKYKGSN